MYALVIAGFLMAGPSAEILALFETKTKCETAIQELSTVEFDKNVLSVGFACVKLEEKQPI